jgi:hypothetical protein
MINMACDRALFCNCSTINDYTSDINVHEIIGLTFQIKHIIYTQ